MHHMMASMVYHPLPIDNFGGIDYEQEVNMLHLPAVAIVNPFIVRQTNGSKHSK
jgi:hypothetical protein